VVDFGCWGPSGRWTGTAVLGLAVATTFIVRRALGPSNPSMTWLTSHGFEIAPLHATEPVVFNPQAYWPSPHVPRTTRMAAELVMFAEKVPGIPERLNTPRPAWLITCAEPYPWSATVNPFPSRCAVQFRSTQLSHGQGPRQAANPKHVLCRSQHDLHPGICYQQDRHQTLGREGSLRVTGTRNSAPTCDESRQLTSASAT
jgi:hypothetical protein